MSKGLKIGFAALVLLLVAGAGVWFLVLRDDAPEEASLREREPAPTTSAAPAESTTTIAPADEFQLPGEDAPDAGSEATVPERPDGGSDSPDGEWILAPDDTGEVFVGYRMQELFGGDTVKATAVGRTLAVSGSMTVEGTTVTDASIVADLTALASERGRRDNFLRTNALETDTFTEATFELTGPFELDEVPGIGEVVEVTVPGELTIHGVTRDVEVPLVARWSGDFIDLSGSIPIRLADYDMDRPDIAGMVTVEDDGIMELQLSFERG